MREQQGEAQGLYIQNNCENETRLDVSTLSTHHGGAVQGTGPGEQRTKKRNCNSGASADTHAKKEAETKDLTISDSDLMKRQTDDIGKIPKRCLEKVLTVN